MTAVVPNVGSGTLADAVSPPPVITASLRENGNGGVDTHVRELGRYVAVDTNSAAPIVAGDARLVGVPSEPRSERLYRRMRFIRRFEESLLEPVRARPAQRHHARVHRPGGRCGRDHGAPRRRRPRVLQPPLPRALPRPHRRRARADGRDHGQAGGGVRGHRGQPAPVCPGLHVERRSGRHRPQRGGHRAREAARRQRRPERCLHRRRHAGRGRHLRDAQPGVAVAAAARRRARGQRVGAEHPFQREPGGQHPRPLRRLRDPGVRDRLDRRRGARRRRRARAGAGANAPGAGGDRDPHIPPVPPLQERRQPPRRRGRGPLGARSDRDPRPSARLSARAAIDAEVESALQDVIDRALSL